MSFRSQPRLLTDYCQGQGEKKQQPVWSVIQLTYHPTEPINNAMHGCISHMKNVTINPVTITRVTSGFSFSDSGFFRASCKVSQTLNHNPVSWILTFILFLNGLCNFFCFFLRGEEVVKKLEMRKPIEPQLRPQPNLNIP